VQFVSVVLGQIALFTACVANSPQRAVTLVFAGDQNASLNSQAAAAVRLRVEGSRSERLRSGVLIDPRGYVLTSFSSVGSVGLSARREGRSRPGTLYDAEDVVVELLDGPFSTVATSYIARVVRGDIRLNLALLRITATRSGTLPPSIRFPFVDLALASREPTWGAAGFVIGAEEDVPSLSVRRSAIVAGLRNSNGGIAGYLVDFSQSSMDGAPYYGADGSFLGVLAGPYLRPSSRVPSSWRAALSTGPIEDTHISGMSALRPGIWAEIDVFGDSFSASEDEYDNSSAQTTEQFYFRLPSGQAGTVVTEPVVLINAYRAGALLGTATGELFVTAETDAYVALQMPRPDDPRGLQLRVRFEPTP